MDTMILDKVLNKERSAAYATTIDDINRCNRLFMSSIVVACCIIILPSFMMDKMILDKVLNEERFGACATTIDDRKRYKSTVSCHQ